MEAEAAAATLLARRTRFAAAAAILLAAIAGAGAVAGLLGQREAEQQAIEAKNSADQARAAEGQALEAGQKAIEARDEALRSQSLALAFLSQQTAASGDTEAAILLALEALRTNEIPPGQRLFEAEAALLQCSAGASSTRDFFARCWSNMGGVSALKVIVLSPPPTTRRLASGACRTGPQ